MRAITRRHVGIALAVIAVAIIYTVKVANRMPDFEVYRQAGVRAAASEPLYRESDGHYQFKYLPAFALVAVPFGALPPAVSRATWFAISVVLLVWLLTISPDLLPERRRTTGVLIGTTSILLAKFYAHEIELGQVNTLMTLLVVAAARQLRGGRDATAGLLLAGSIVVKPYAVIFLPYLLARRRAAPLAAAAAGLGFALLAPAALYGFSGNLALLGGWWRTVMSTTAPNLGDFNNVSAASVFTRALGPGPPARVASELLVLALLAAAAFVFVRRKGVECPEGLEIALLLTMMPIISPQGWDYVFLVSTPAIMFLVNYRDTLPGWLRGAVTVALIVIAFSLFDLMGRQAYRTFMSWSMITWCYLVVIAGLVALRIRRAA